MSRPRSPGTPAQMARPDVVVAAKAAWDADRKMMAETHPAWPIPAWSRAPAWRRRPYILDALAEPAA